MLFWLQVCCVVFGHSWTNLIPIMFEQLTLQIRHQYGKYLVFTEAKNGNNDPIMGIKDGHYSKDETIVRLIPTRDRDGNEAYQIQHQYGKYLNFNEAANGNNDVIMGIRKSYSVLWFQKGCYEDETIVRLIPGEDKHGNNAYQIKHQYGKFLNFNEAALGNNDPIMGIRDRYSVLGFQRHGCYRDETIVSLIPINYKFVIKIENFRYGEPRVQSVTDCVKFSSTFKNETGADQVQAASHKVALNKSITFKHSKMDVQNWLSKVSGGINISAKSKTSHPNMPSADINFEYSWTRKTVDKFRESLVENSIIEVEVKNELTIKPHTTVVCEYVSNQLQSNIPYTAQMEISCEVGGDYVSRARDMEFMLYNTGKYPKGGDTRVTDGKAVYCIELTGEIMPSIDLDCTTKVKSSTA